MRFVEKDSLQDYSREKREPSERNEHRDVQTSSPYKVRSFRPFGKSGGVRMFRLPTTSIGFKLSCSLKEHSLDLFLTIFGLTFCTGFSFAHLEAKTYDRNIPISPLITLSTLTMDSGMKAFARLQSSFGLATM